MNEFSPFSPEREFADRAPETERRRPVEFTILEPTKDRTFCLRYTAASRDEAIAYNLAIASVLREAKLIPYQVDGDINEPNNAPGEHTWEANPSHRNIVKSRRQLEALIDRIHRAAEEYARYAA